MDGVTHADVGLYPSSQPIVIFEFRALNLGRVINEDSKPYGINVTAPAPKN